jgi:hypothetical protein
MLESLLRSIGVNDDIRTHLDHVAWRFERPLFFWFGLALLVPLAWFIYQRQRHNLSSMPRALRLALTATRVAVLFLLIVVLAAPYLRLDLTQDKKPVMALVIDRSQSMGLPAGPFDTDAEVLAAAKAVGLAVTDGKVDAATRKALNEKTRASFVREAIEHQAGEWLKPLVERYDLRLYSVDATAKRLPALDDSLKLPEVSTTGGETYQTHLGDAVSHVVDEAAGRQIAGIVIFSDGENTGGRSPADAAREAKDLGAPVIAVPAGSPAMLRDLAIVDVFAPDEVASQDTVNVAVTLGLQGYAEQAVKVELLDGDKPLASHDLVLRSTEQQHVDLAFKADKVDEQETREKLLTVKVTPTAELADELTKSNNSEQVVVTIKGDRLRVLYIEGLPRWDFRFLKNAMRRDNGIGGRGVQGSQVVAAIATTAPAPGTPAVATPASPPAAIGSGTTNEPDIVLEAEVRRRPANDRDVLPDSVEALAEYHTIILGDASPALVDSDFRRLLSEAVREHGVGLIVEAGPNSMPHAYDREFQELLPVKLARGVPGREAPAYKPYRLRLAPAGGLHETTRLYDDAGRNENVWAQMPPFYWCAAVERASPAATVLAFNDSLAGPYGDVPLVAHHYAGQGQVLFIGTDSTWLWRQNVGDRFYYKFWGQAVRFVARRDTGPNKKNWLKVRPVRARPGEPAQIELMAYRADGAPRTDSQLMLRVEREGGASETVEMIADQATVGRYTGNYVPETEGNYRLVFDPGEGQEPIDRPLHVRPSVDELRRPNVNLEALAQLGTVVELGKLASITGELKGEAKTTTLHREAEIWDNWLMLSLLILIYSVDVGLRRLAGLS